MFFLQLILCFLYHESFLYQESPLPQEVTTDNSADDRTTILKGFESEITNENAQGQIITWMLHYVNIFFLFITQYS